MLCYMSRRRNGALVFAVRQKARTSAHLNAVVVAIMSASEYVTATAGAKYGVSVATYAACYSTREAKSRRRVAPRRSLSYGRREGRVRIMCGVGG